MGVDFITGAKVRSKVSGEKEDGTTVTIEYTFNYVTIDELTGVTIKQFDKNDVMVEKTCIDKDRMLNELSLNANTEYYFIIEEYMGSNGIKYQKRTYVDSNTYIYLYKYTNLDGFLNGDRLTIDKP